MAVHLGYLFPGMEVLESHTFRVTRDADIEFEEDHAEDLIDEIERELLHRRFRPPYGSGCASHESRTSSSCCCAARASTTELYEVPGPQGLADLFDLSADVDQTVLYLPSFRTLRPSRQTPPELMDPERQARPTSSH